MTTHDGYDVYLWWPEDAAAMIHPEDVDAARALIPSDRVLHRAGRQGEYQVVEYGEAAFRIKPTLCLPVEGVRFKLGAWVEIRSRGGRNEYGIGAIAERRWNRRTGEIRYYVHARGRTIPRGFEADDLQPLEHPWPPAQEGTTGTSEFTDPPRRSMAGATTDEMYRIAPE